MSQVSFKILTVADVLPDEDELISYEHEKKQLDELTTIQRLRRSRNARKNKAKLKAGRRRASRRTAGRKVLTRRAGGAARRAMVKRILHGRSKASLSAAGKTALEKRIKQKAGALKTLTRKLIPAARKRDLARRRK